MTTHHKDLCPCGSGKRYKHCHLPTDEAKRRRAWMVAIGALAAIVVGVGAWGAIQRGQAARTAATRTESGTAGGLAPGAGAGGGDVSGAAAPTPSGAFGTVVPGRNSQAPIPMSPAGSITPPRASSGALAPGEHPTPWEFDVARNRYYDPRPGHEHWHTGPPPADTSKVVSSPTVATPGGGGASPIVTVGGGSAKVTTTTVPVTNSGSAPLAPGENPAPWEYDRAKDRHFDPRDAHRHWHAGPPPAVSERGK